MDIIATVEQLNKKGTEINQKRERLLGQLQNVDSQIDAKLADYNKKHNTKLSVKEIPDEHKRVEAETIKKAEETAELIQKIESGDFVEKKVTVDVADEPAIVQVKTEVKQEVAVKEEIKPAKTSSNNEEEIDFDEDESGSHIDKLLNVDIDEEDDFIDAQEESKANNDSDEDVVDDGDDMLFSDIKNVMKGR